MLNKVLRYVPPVVMVLVIQAKFQMAEGNTDWLTTFVTFFVAILLEAMPFVLIGSLLAGAIEVFVPKERIAQIVPRNRFQAVLLFGLLGIIFPVCECGIVPVIRRLLQKGVPLSCGVTYLLAAPIVQPIVLAATFVAFNGSWRIAIARVVGGYLAAVSVGLMATVVLDPRAHEHLAFSLDDEVEDSCGCGSVDCEHQHDHAEHEHDHDANEHDHAGRVAIRERETATVGAGSTGSLPPAHAALAASSGIPLPVIHDHEHAHHDHDHSHHAAPATAMGKLDFVLKHAAEEFLSTGYYLIFGAFLAAAMQTFIGQNILSQLAHGPVASSFVMMVLAFTLSLCSAADAFVAAAFTQFTIPARMAFMVMGPMVDVKLVAMYNGFLSRKATFFVFGSAAALAFIYSQALRIIGFHG